MEHATWLWQILLAYALGLVSSASFWLVITHWISPRLEFADRISLDSSADGHNYSQAAFKNSGYREIVDVDIYVRVGVDNLLGNSIWSFQNLKTNGTKVPSLLPGERRLIYIFDERHNLEFLDRPAEPFRKSLEKCKSVKDILTLGSDAQITVHVFGYDKFSGARKSFSSRPYRLIDVEQGSFDGIEIRPV